MPVSRTASPRWAQFDWARCLTQARTWPSPPRQKGHRKARIQAALRTSALRNAVSASNSRAGAIADSQLGELFEKVVRAQHSQSNEREAVDYAMGFMKAKRYQPGACVAALEKLAAMSRSDSTSFLSTHPSPKERAERMKTQVA